MNHSASAAREATSGTAAVRTARITPSPPMPDRRSHSAATSEAVRSSSPAGSGTTTKSFSVPWPLITRTRSSVPVALLLLGVNDLRAAPSATRRLGAAPAPAVLRELQRHDGGGVLPRRRHQPPDTAGGV